MWHSPNQRIRAIANAKKRERERARRPFHVKRIVAKLEFSRKEEVSPDSSPHTLPVRVVLNDLSSKGVGLFSQTAIVPGELVYLRITEPMKLDIRCRVVWCQEHAANTHVLSQERFGYRFGVEFILPTSEEQQSVQAFWEEICKSYLYSVQAV